MAITRAYEYLGALDTPEGPRHVVRGKYSILSTDTYLRATQCTLTFSMLARVEYVLGMYTECVAGTGLIASLSGLSTNVATFAMLESGGAGVTFPEKTNAEAYGQDYDFYVVVVGQ